jgi:2,4-dienoyl-CoA reductase-like NADH-dependent reductase (Old Yellow Enzyme family)
LEAEKLTAPKHHNDVFIMVKLTAERIKFIVQTFLDAAHNKKFQGKWMTQIHGQNLLDCFYKPPLDCCLMEKPWCIPLEDQSG